MDGHGGYDWPFSPFGLWPFRPSAEEHDWHHSKNLGNFASFFTVWDDLCGTDRHTVEARLAQRAAARKAPPSNDDDAAFLTWADERRVVPTKKPAPPPKRRSSSCAARRRWRVAHRLS